MSKFDKKIVITASILGAISIAFGAFGAHGLKEFVNEQTIDSFNTGVRYQMYHAIVLLILGLSSMIPTKTKKQVYWSFLIGIVLFSGSIYLLSMKEILSIKVSFIGLITPIGGLLFIWGWVCLGHGIYKLKSE